FDLRGADVFREIEVGGEIELAGPRLVEVPKDVGAKGVEAHGAHLAHAVAPVGARDARVVHFAGADEEGCAVEEELVGTGGEGVGRGWRLGGDRQWTGQEACPTQKLAAGEVSQRVGSSISESVGRSVFGS